MQSCPTLTLTLSGVLHRPLHHMDSLYQQLLPYTFARCRRPLACLQWCRRKYPPPSLLSWTLHPPRPPLSQPHRPSRSLRCFSSLLTLNLTAPHQSLALLPPPTDLSVSPTGTSPASTHRPICLTNRHLPCGSGSSELLSLSLAPQGLHGPHPPSP